MTTPELVKRVEDALDTLRPYLEADKGNVSLIDITDDMVVRLRFHGACSSCSMSAMTLKAGIEQAILRSVPEIREVKAIQEDEESLA
ncbi:MAG: NifU family protein [Bacteroidetes bacterium]|nr:NifU family protein [Bacteroidota bacterium]MBL0065942.1 NifU family protein [Bacteroidota bacterium]MBL0138010.1 NifU family protein [Bacteroidota bacterium]